MVLLAVTVSLLAAALALLYYYFTNTFGHWRDRGVPFVAPTPLVGSMGPVMTLREHMRDLFLRCYTQHSDQRFFGFFQSRTPCLVIRDPALVKLVLVKDFAHFVDHGLKIHEEADPLEAKSLFNLEGQRWKEMRAALTPTFTSGRMKAMFPLVLESAELFEKVLGELANTGEAFDSKELLARYTTDVIGSCAFGIKCDSLRDPDCHFRVMGKSLLEMTFWRGIKTFVMFFIPEIGVKFRMAFLTHEQTEYFRGMVRDVMAQRAKDGATRKDFMQLLIELKEKGRLTDEEGDEKTEETNESKSTPTMKLTHDDVTAQAMVFFFAGFDTASSMMSFALLELAANPAVQRRLQTELDATLEKHEGKLSYQALQDMQYLDWVIQETLRKYPPVVHLFRVCNKSYRIPDSEVTIEPGVQVIVPIHALQNDPKYFPDPERFDPERFSTDQGAQKNQYVYMPFGEGPRQCIGNRFAMMQSKLGLLAVLRRFEVSLAPQTRYPPIMDPKEFALKPLGGCWIKLAPRSEE